MTASENENVYGSRLGSYDFNVLLEVKGFWSLGFEVLLFHHEQETYPKTWSVKKL